MAGGGNRLRGWKCFSVIVVGFLVVAALFVSAEDDGARREGPRTKADHSQSLLASIKNFLWQKGRVGYTHVWPVKTLLVFVNSSHWLLFLMD